MKKIVLISFLVLGLALVAVVPSEAWHGYPHYRSHVYIGVGPVYGPYPYGPYPYWYDPYYPRYVYAPPPPVVIEEPPVYVQRPAAAPPPPPAPPAPPTAAAEAYWYYCPSAKAYYPGVATCPEQWVKIPPRP